MSFSDMTGGLSAADLAAVIGNNDGGFGGNNGLLWLLVILFAFNGGWGNNCGNGNGAGSNYVASDVQRGFDQSAVMNALAGLNTVASNGFANAEVSRCNQMTNLMQSFSTLQQGLCNQFNTLGMNQMNAHYEDQVSFQQGVQAILAAMNNGFQSVNTQMAAGIQSIHDKLCQQEIDNLKTQLANTQTALNLANLRESQTAQTANILADNARQTAALEQYLNPPAIPAYMVQNPNCCNQNVGCCNGVSVACGCGGV